MVPTFWNCPENYIFFRWIMTLRSNYFYKNLIHISYDCLYSVIFRYLPFMDYSLVVTKGLVKLNKAMSRAMQDHPRWTSHSGEFWKKVVHWRRKWQPTPVFLPQEPYEQYKKGKKIWHWKMSPSGQKVSYMLLGKSGGQLLIPPERMKWLGQSRNDAQQWMHLVVKVKSSAVRTILHRNLEC